MVSVEVEMLHHVHSYSGSTVFAAARAISICLPQAMRGIAVDILIGAGERQCLWDDDLEEQL